MYSHISSKIRFNYLGKSALVIFVHGYKGNKDELAFLQDYLYSQGVSYLAISYGQRTRSNEVATLKGVNQELNGPIQNFLRLYPTTKVILVGYSLGAGIAVDYLSKKYLHCNGLVLISCFDNRQEMLRERGIEIRRMENLMPISTIVKLTIPIVWIHGSKDRSIPIGRAKRVYNQYQGARKYFIEIPTDHYFEDKNEQGHLIQAIGTALGKLGIHSLAPEFIG